MLNQRAQWKDSLGVAVVLAVASSVFFAGLFWVWERELLWMLAVILPPIWSPVIYRRFATDDDPERVGQGAVRSLVIGLVLLLGVGLLVYAAA